MNLVTVDSFSAPLKLADSASWRMAQRIVWGSLSLAILSGWFVVARLGLRHDLRVWDIIALRFGEGTVLLTSVVAIFVFDRVVVLLGPRAAAATVALLPVAATLFAE